MRVEIGSSQIDQTTRSVKRERVTVGRGGCKGGFRLAGRWVWLHDRLSGDGAVPAGMEGMSSEGRPRAEYTESSVLTSDERQPLSNNVPAPGNGKLAQR